MKTKPSNYNVNRLWLRLLGAAWLITSLFAMVGSANAINTTNLVLDGDFESPNGDAGPWQNQAGGDYISFPSTGGNPDGCGQITDYGTWGVFAYVNPTPGPSTQPTLASLGLTAGQTYTFLMDMQIVSGANIGGLKIESWTDSYHISDSGDMRPFSGSSSWATYSFTYKIATGATHLNIVPLWGPNSTVNYDNIGVVIPGPAPASVSITSPTNSQVVYSNFLINASASVNPGAVTNVSFYIDSIFAGRATNSPFACIATGVSAGAHALKAVARDNNGNSATSSVVNITVTNAPIPVFAAYEPFNYPQGALAGGTASTGTGFAGNWTCGAAGTIVAGLTYPLLPTADNALQSSSWSQLESLANVPYGVGTVWVSFIFQQAGDNGGNRDGFVLEDGSGNGVMFAYQQFQSTFGDPALVKVSGYTAVGSQLSPHSGNTQTYNANNFYVLKLTYSGGSLSSVAVYTNPTAGTSTEPAAPDFTVTSGLSGIGVLSVLGVVHQATMSITVDEVRCGTTYGSVVAAGGGGAVPTTLALSVASGNEVSWTAVNTDSYQPQSSADGVNWNNLGGVLVGSAVSSVYDPSLAAFYQVLDYTIGGYGNAEPNGSFEILDGEYSTGAYGWNGQGSGVDGNGNTISQYVTNSWGGTVNPVDGTNLLYTEVATPATGPVTPPNVWLHSDLFPIPAGGVTYPVSFSACKPVNVGGNPQYRIEFWDAGYNYISSSGYMGIAGGSTWTTISNNFVAPTNAAFMLINFIFAIGSGNGWDLVTLLDNIQVDYPLPGPTVVLTPTVQSGAIFTATVQTNEVTATGASGFVYFQINSVAQSAGMVSGGIANSAPAVVPASYTVTAIYNGDSTYMGSTNTLVVGGGVNTTPTNIVTSVSGNQLTLTWPADHTGWTLQVQTNSINTGLSTTWHDVPGSTAINQVIITIDPANPTVFYRLKY